MENVKVGDQVVITKDSAEGYYQDLVSKVVTVVDVSETDEAEIPYFYLVTGTDRDTKDDLLEGDEEMVSCHDIKIVERGMVS